jgi:hypothetical protein
MRINALAGFSAWLQGKEALTAVRRLTPRAITQAIPPRVRFNISVIIFVLAFALRLAMMVSLERPPDLYDNEMHRASRALARTGTLADPYACQTGPTAHVAPGYAAVLAMIYRTSGHPGVWIGVLTSLASALTYALLPWLTEAIGLWRGIGISAGLLGAGFPWLPGLEARGPWEAPWVACLLIIAVGFTARGYSVAAGFAWGVAFLFGPALLPVFIMLLARQRAKRFGIVVATIAFAVVAPWVVRNYMQFGRVFWIRSNMGLELQVSNNSGARPNGFENLRRTQSFAAHPSHSYAACAMMHEMGEGPYMDTQMRVALRWITGHFVEFARLTVVRAMYFWNPPYGTLPRRIALFIITLLGVVGAVLASQRNLFASGLFFGVILGFPLMFYVIQADPRYRAPIHPVILVAAMVTIHRILRGLTRVEAANELQDHGTTPEQTGLRPAWWTSKRCRLEAVLRH